MNKFHPGSILPFHGGRGEQGLILKNHYGAMFETGSSTQHSLKGHSGTANANGDVMFDRFSKGFVILNSTFNVLQIFVFFL